MEKYEEPQHYETNKNDSPLRKILYYVGWCVLSRLFEDAKKNEDYELCAEIKELFIESNCNIEDFIGKNEIPLSDFSKEYTEVSEVLMNEYITRAKKFLNITEY